MASFSIIKVTKRSDGAVAKRQVCDVEVWYACCLRPQVIGCCSENAVEWSPKAGVVVQEKVELCVVVVEQVQGPGTENNCEIVLTYHYE